MITDGVSLEILTDEDILDYSRVDGKDCVLTDHRDILLRTTNPTPYPGGTYDVDIFGSPLRDRCICGKMSQATPHPCPQCQARVFTDEQALRRFARIEFPFYYLQTPRLPVLNELMAKIFEDSKIEFAFLSLEDMKYSGYISAERATVDTFKMKLYDSCQFEYFPKKKTLKISEEISDIEKSSYEGLMDVIANHFPKYLVDYKRLINRYYLVQPARLRPFSMIMQGGEKKMRAHKLSVWYNILIRLCCAANRNANNKENFDEVMSMFSTDGEKVRYVALLRALINAGRREATDLLNTSKKNFARILYSVRTKNSARCPIVPDVKIDVDEITIPPSIAYEMCREGFINHLQEELNFTKREAMKASKMEVDNPELMKKFKEYAEKQVVLVGRNPSLHEYSMFASKLRIGEESQYCIGFPLMLCEPLGGDFDGDTVSIQLVSENAAEDTYNLMSPRYVNVYKKTNTPIFQFTHEAMNGAVVASEYVFDKLEELEDPKEFYDDYTELVKDVEVHKKLNIGKPIRFTGKVGGVDYKMKITSYGRLRISKIIEADLDLIKIFDKPHERLSAKSAAKLCLYLYQFPDSLEKLQKLQEFFHRVITKAGVVTFDYKTLYANSDTETYKKICQISDSPDLTDKQKLLLMNESYLKYEKEIADSFSSDLKSELSRVNRVKMTSIAAMTMPQLIISGVDEKPMITKGTLLSGFTESDFQIHSIENRSIQSMKVSGVKLLEVAHYKQRNCWKEAWEPKSAAYLVYLWITTAKTRNKEAF